MTIAPTPKDTILRDGTASLYRFRNPVGDDDRPVLFLVPSMINKWYVLDLHENASLASACVDAGFDTYCLDWGTPNDEDRYLTWDLVLDRLGRMVRKVKRHSGKDEIGMLGYCMGATLCGIWNALNPGEVAAFCNLAGPFDFSEAGTLGVMVDRQWFDPESLTAAGNLPARQMQTGFVAMRPTSQIGKWVSLADKWSRPGFLEAFKALDTWADDNIPFPGSAYVTYIKELYQDNSVVKGEHFVRGKRADLGNITCPVLTIATSRDHICPAPAAQGLHDNVGSDDKEMIVVKGGHVGAVVGSKARELLYPVITEWFSRRVGAEPVVLRDVTDELEDEPAVAEVLSSGTPTSGIEALSEVKYVGDWIAVQAHDELGIKSVAELIEAAQTGKLQALNGIGAAKEKAILEAARDHQTRLG